MTIDHCFKRIVPDRLFGVCWYSHLERRITACKQLNEEQLRTCIAMAELLLAGDTEVLAEWN